MDESSYTVPTASERMMNASVFSGKVNGSLSGVPHGKGNSRRSRSKSESAASILRDAKPKEIVQIGGVLKTNKDKTQDRKPRTLKGRGMPKKGGGGGKHTWGKPGEIYEEGDEDENDPNYDSDNEVSYVLEQVTPELTGEQFNKMVEPLILEYFEHGDTGEVVVSLSELNFSHLKHQLTALAVSMALEKKATQRELTSVLISDLYGEKILREQEIELGFQALMNKLDDLTLDTPDAAELLGCFMARAVADDCVSPSFLKEHEDNPSQVARDSVHKAATLLRMKHGFVRLDNVWGVSGGSRPVKLLIKKMVLLLKEYLSSKDMKEAIRCVQDLDVPHFHHELVYEAIVIVLEEGSKHVMQEMACLLKHFADTALVTKNQMTAGFERIYNALEDLVLDIPHAYSILSMFVDLCAKEGVISLSLREKAPTRVGRKRFVSEGDQAF